MHVILPRAAPITGPKVRGAVAHLPDMASRPRADNHTLACGREETASPVGNCRHSVATICLATFSHQLTTALLLAVLDVARPTAAHSVDVTGRAHCAASALADTIVAVVRSSALEPGWTRLGWVSVPGFFSFHSTGLTAQAESLDAGTNGDRPWPSTPGYALLATTV